MAIGSRKEYELLLKLKAISGSGFNSTFKNAINTTKTFQNRLSELRSTQNDISAYKKTQEAVERLKEKKEQLINSDKDSTREIERVNQKIEDEENKLLGLENKLNNVGISTNNLSDENKKLSDSYDSIKKSQEEYARINKKIEDNNTKISDTKRGLIKDIGVATGTAAAMYKGFIEPSAEYQAKLSEIKAIIGGTPKEMNILSNKARQMGETTVFSATEIADSFKYFAVAGAGPSRMLESLNGIINLAQGSGLELSSTAEIVADSLQAFGMKTKDTDHYANVLAATTNVANVEVSQLGETMKYCAPAAKLLGYTADDTATAVALMANAGIKASQAGTTLRASFTRLAAPPKTAAAEMERLGLSLTDSKGKMKPFSSVIQELRGHFKKMTETQQVQSAAALFGQNAMSGMAEVLRATGDDFDDIVEGIQNADTAFNGMGSAVGMAKTRVDNLKGDMALASGAWKELSLTVGDMFQDSMREGIQKLTEFIQSVRTFIKENPEAVKNIAKIAAGFLALKVGGKVAKLGFLEIYNGVLKTKNIITLFKTDFTKLGAEGVKNLTGMAKGVSLLKGAFTLLSGPVGWTIGALAVVAGGIYLYNKAQEKARQETIEFSKDLKNAADNFQKVSDNTKDTQALIDEYRELSAKVKDTSLSTDKATAAKKRLKEIEDKLIEQNPDVLSKYDAETGRVNKNLKAIEKKIEREQELARFKYESEQEKAQDKLPDNLKMIGELTDKTKNLDSQYDTVKSVRDGLREIIKEQELFNAQAHTEAEKAERFSEAIRQARELGVDVTHFGGITTSYMDYNRVLNDTVNEIEKSNTELNTAKKSVQDYYNASKNLVELDLGGSFKSTAEKLSKLKSELVALDEKGKGGSKQAQNIKVKISELEPKVLSAAAKIRDLGVEVSKIPEVKTINVSNALKGIDGFLAKLKKIPTSIETKLTVQKSGGKVPGYATGGIITKPTLATFAEEGPEAAIPLDGSANAKSLWLKAGHMLGMNTPSLISEVKNYSTETKVKPLTVIPTRSGSEVQQFNIQYSPTIHVDGNKPGDLEDKLRQNNESLIALIMERIRDKEDNERRMIYA